VSSPFEIPMHLALTLVLANGAPLPGHVDPAVLAPRVAQRTASRPRFGYDEARWLDAVSRHGAEAGLGDLAARVFRTSSGVAYAPVRADHHAIMALLADPALTGRMAAVAARADAARILALTGRAATAAELFAAHLLGIDGAERLIARLPADAGRPATEVLPTTALRHPELFFTGVRPRSIGEVMHAIEAALARALPVVRKT